jgi:D-alanyl-D-alanine carboxypeptidase (penicillin-binding protein 5/6)
MKRIYLFAVLTMALGLATGGLYAAPKQPQKSSAKKSAPAKAATIAKNPYLGAIVIDAASGRVLVEDQADAKGYPASMLKLTDLLIILEKLKAGQLSLQDKVTVSAKAAKTGGSQVWLDARETFTIEDLLYALMIQSANDSAVALAEKVGGSTEGFVALMNQKAAQLGMRQTKFNSVHGLPPSPGVADDVTTPRDFALLCRELVLKHPEALQYTSARERTFRPGPRQVVMRSHNHLLASLPGCDGLKTGYITKAGYSIAVTASRNGRRVIAVVLDSVDRITRDRKAAELVNKGFAVLDAAGPGPAAAPAPAPLTSPSRK